jgi:hypothetical protein
MARGATRAQRTLVHCPRSRAITCRSNVLAGISVARGMCEDSRVSEGVVRPVWLSRHLLGMRGVLTARVGRLLGGAAAQGATSKVHVPTAIGIGAT